MLRAKSSRIRRRDSYRGLVQGSMAPSRRPRAGVGDDERLVVLQDGAEAVAVRAGAARVVEGEERRGHHCGGRVAGAAGGEPGEPEASGGLRRARPEIVDHQRDPFALLERGGQRLGQAAGVARAGHQPVHHDQQLARAGQVESRGKLVEMTGPAVREHPDEAQRAEVLHHRRVRQPGHRRQREDHLQPAARHRRQNVVRGRLGRVAPHRGAADPAEAAAHPRPEQPEVVVDLGGGADGGPAADDGIALLDGHGGGDPLEVVHQRLRHALEELLGVGGERLDVAALALGVEGVEGERALARARRAGHDDERPVRQLDGDPLQVVLPGVDDANRGLRHRAEE